MPEWTLEIAGLPVCVRSSSQGLLDALAARCQAFTSESASPLLHVLIEWDPDQTPVTHPSPAFSFQDARVIFNLPGYAGTIDLNEGGALRLSTRAPVSAAEYFLRVCYAQLAHRSGGLLVHAAGIVRNGRAYLFIGPSGAGKTTVARQSPGDLVLNDDLVILMPDDGRWIAHGTPFTNPTQIQPAKASAPAAALLRLVQGPDVSLTPLTGALALAELLAASPVLNGAPEPPLDRCREILAAVPAYRLEFLPDPSFWPDVEKI